MWNNALDLSSDELCLIDSGIHNLKEIPLHSGLQVLNLHCNQVQCIDNLGNLQHLRHLDLSSNQISRIEGLEALVSLRTLNLACNLIQTIDGISNLRSAIACTLKN